MSKTEHEILFELRRLGNVVKASAIDVGTNTEVCVVGPANAPEQWLKSVALRKLRYVMARNQARTQSR